jgi:type II secretory pathway pseudopilin PulG
VGGAGLRAQTGYAVIDTTTREMWITDLPKSSGASAPDTNLRSIAEIYCGNKGKSSKAHLRLLKLAGPTGVAGFPFANWEVPRMGAFERLIDG